MLSGERSAQPRGSGRSRPPAARPIDRGRPRPDLIAVLALLVLVALGLMNLKALGQQSLFNHQAITVVIGFVLFVVARRFRASDLRWLSWVVYLLSVVLLVAVGVAGSVDFGARRWLTFGSLTLQPSELAKVGVLLVLALVLGSRKGWVRRLLVALLLGAIPIVLVVLEPDLSTATVLTALLLAMLIIGRIPLRVIATLAIVCGVVAPFAERLLHPYQLERLHGFLGGSGGTSGTGWTIMQAHIALAWGRLTGTANNPMHRILAEYLPARETDLAFASLVEQWGIIAGVIAVLAAVALVWRCAVASRQASTPAAAFLSAGFAALIGIEVSISVAANLGLIPTAGVPFPLLSYGGTAAVVHIAMVGLVLSLRTEAERHRLWLAPSWLRLHPRLVRATAFVTTAGLISMVGFAVQLQRSQGDELRASGLFQMTRCVPVLAPRGQITDRHGVPLAENITQDKVWVAPGIVTPTALDRVAAMVARPVQVLRSAVRATPDGPFVTAGTVPVDLGRRITNLDLRGVVVVPETKQYYPYGSLLGSVLGWSGVATPADLKRWPDLKPYQTVGRAGLEQIYDPILRGRDGEECVYVNPAGRPVAMARSVAPQRGSTLRLSIDLGMQRELRTALAAALGQGGDMAGAEVMDPQNGQLLAMVSLPSYNDNLFGPPVHTAALARLAKRHGYPMIDKVSQVASPPGSTFKLTVASANMIHHAVPPKRIVPTGGSWTVDGHTFHNWGDLPPQNMEQAIAWSNDVYFYKLAWALGANAIIKTASQLGVGHQTGIDLPGESPGYLGTPKSVKSIGATWYPGSTVLLGIGQGYLTTTPLQDAVWTAGVATGAVVTPHLGMSYKAPHAATYTALPYRHPRHLWFANKLGPVRIGMREAVTGGTATPLMSLPVAAGGKTGTAEDPTAPGAAGTDSWLSAVAPMHHPIAEATAFIHGGPGTETSTEPVNEALAYFFAHKKEILAKGEPRRHSPGTAHKSGHGKAHKPGHGSTTHKPGHGATHNAGHGTTPTPGHGHPHQPAQGATQAPGSAHRPRVVAHGHPHAQHH